MIPLIQFTARCCHSDSLLQLWLKNNYYKKPRAVNNKPNTEIKQAAELYCNGKHGKKYRLKTLNKGSISPLCHWPVIINNYLLLSIIWAQKYDSVLKENYWTNVHLLLVPRTCSWSYGVTNSLKCYPPTYHASNVQHLVYGRRNLPK